MQEVCAWESETMAVQLVPDSALSLLMVSAWEAEPRQRPAPASPHHTRTPWSAAAASVAADTFRLALLYPACSSEMISGVRVSAMTKHSQGKEALDLPF